MIIHCILFQPQTDECWQWFVRQGGIDITKAAFVRLSSNDSVAASSLHLLSASAQNSAFLIFIIFSHNRHFF
jgi:hypothetical protein